MLVYIVRYVRDRQIFMVTNSKRKAENYIEQKENPDAYEMLEVYMVISPDVER